MENIYLGKFSPYLKKKKELITKLILDLGKKYQYVSILGTDVSGDTVTVDRSTINVVPASISECGFVLKAYQNGLYSEFSFNEINEKNISELIIKMDSLLNQKYVSEKVMAPLFDEEPLTKTFNRKPVGKNYSCNEIIDILKSYVDEIVKDNSCIVNAQVSIENVEISKIFMACHKGVVIKDLKQYYTWSNPRSFVICRNETNTKYAYDGFGSNNVEQNLCELKESLKKSFSTAKDLLNAELPVPGYYDIITDPSISGLIAHEAFGHGVEMDMFVKDRAQAPLFIDKKVASNLISMHDGAKATYSVASYFFDDDGVLAQDTKIIDKGILRRGISDNLSALELGTKPTGNGRRQSYKRKSYTRMTNTFFEKGNDDVNEMIKSIEYGYYIATTNNGMEDPKNWGIQCTAHYGREIRNGEFTGKIISPVVMSGYVIDLLKSISKVSTDFKVIGSGSCGKGYKEWVRVSDGGPYLKAKVKIG